MFKSKKSLYICGFHLNDCPKSVIKGTKEREQKVEWNEITKIAEQDFCPTPGSP